MSHTTMHLLLKDHKAVEYIDHWNSDIREHEISERELQHPLPYYLTRPVEVGDNFTFGDLWKMIEDNADLFNVIFHGSMGGHNIEMYAKDAARTPKEEAIPGPEEEGMHYLCVYRRCECWTYRRLDKDFNHYASFHGVGLNRREWAETEEEKQKLHPECYAVEMTPICDLLKYPFKLDKKLEIWNFDSSTKAARKQPPQKLFEGEQGFTLFEVIEAVLDEISFFGEPEDRDAQLEELQQTVKDIESGEEKTIPIEEVWKELRQSQIDDLKKKHPELTEEQIIEQFKDVIIEERDDDDDE